MNHTRNTNTPHTTYTQHMCITKSNINHTQRTYNKDISNIYHKITYTAHTPYILHTVISHAMGTKHTHHS